MELQTICAFSEVVSAYENAVLIDSACPPPSPSTVHDTPPASPIIPPQSINPLAPFPMDGTPPPAGAPFPELPPPSEWCGGCRQIAAAGSNSVIQCAECEFRYHVECVLKADWDLALDNPDGWLCVSCLSSILNKPATWSDDL